jgi:GNAT superfamily N-acetyltransferase
MFESIKGHEAPIIRDNVTAERNAKERGDLVLAAIERTKKSASTERRFSFLTAGPDDLKEFRGIKFEPYDHRRHHEGIRAILNAAMPMSGPDYVANYVRDVSTHGVGPEGDHVQSERWWVATDKAGEPLGIAGLYQYSADRPDHVWLNWFALRQDLQGTGFGVLMLEHTMAWARQGKKSKIFMLTDDHPSMQGNAKFYQREGCAVVAVLDKAGIHADADCDIPHGVLQYLYAQHKEWIDDGVTWFLRSKAL